MKIQSENYIIKSPIKKEYKTEIKTSKQSTIDPNSGYMYRDEKPKGFFYLDHRTIDSKENIITDVYVAPGNINDVDPYISRLDEQINKFGFNVRYVGLDAGYYTNPICKQLDDRNIRGAKAYRLGPHVKGLYTKNSFQYVKELDIYVCPVLYPLKYITTTRQAYSEYRCDPTYCTQCNLKENCLTNKQDYRTIRRHVREKYKEETKKFTKSEVGRHIYKRRKETVERSFADSKQLHGYRYCRIALIEKNKKIPFQRIDDLKSIIGSLLF